MNLQKPKIEFYKQRIFSEKFDATFSFIRENWKPLLKYSFYLIMPVCLIQAYAMNSFLDMSVLYNYDVEGGAMRLISYYGLTGICYLVGFTLLSGMTYAMMQIYNTRENRLIDITFEDFKASFLKNIKRYLLIMLFFIAAIFLVALVLGLMSTALSPGGMILVVLLIILAVFIAMLFLVMLLPIYLFETKISFFEAIAKSFRLGAATFGSMLGFLIVISIISSVLQSIITLPWYTAYIVNFLFSTGSGAEAGQSAGYNFLLYLLGIIQAYGVYLTSIISLVGVAFHYFHAREKVEGVTVDTNISNFDQL